MEINGLSNIHILIDAAVNQNTECHQEISTELADTIKAQLVHLERYMLAYADRFKLYAPIAEDGVPKWHTVRDDRGSFPTLKERVGS